MADRISKLQRWLDLIAHLASRRFPVPLDELWASVPAYALPHDPTTREHERVRRMFERDKEELREMGIPIETVTYHINYGLEERHGYRLAKRDFHLPYLRLVQEAAKSAGEPEAADTHPGPRRRVPPATPGEFAVTEDEVGAALEGLREVAALPSFPLAPDARAAFRKLAFDLDPEALEEPSVVYVEDPEASATADALKLLSEALRQGKRVRFRYRSMGRDEEVERAVRPYGLLFQHGRWYLIAWAEDRDAVRMFRVGRMRSVEVNRARPGTPDYTVPDDFRLEDYAGRKAWELGQDPGGPAEAHVRFRFPRSLWAERNGHGQLLAEGEDGAQLRSFRIRRRDPFLRWVLSLEGDARVEAPPDLAEAFRGMAAAVEALYGGEEDGPDG
jgi:predicted DNA-binding transcriptional regulator YafY